MLKRLAAILVLSLSISAYAAEIPVDAKLDYNQGIDFYKLGMYERAIESFRSATRTYPDYVDAYYNLGTVLEYIKQYAAALSAYKQVYVRNPNDYEVVYKMAFLSSKLEDYDKAAEYIKPFRFIALKYSFFDAKSYAVSTNGAMTFIRLTSDSPDFEWKFGI